MKSKILLLLLTFGYAFSCVGQGHYVITFVDKNNTPYSINNPQQFLTQKAIERRAKQNIPITISDLPVNITYVDAIKNKGAALVYTSKWLNALVAQFADTSSFVTIRNLPFVKSIALIKSSKQVANNKAVADKFAPETAQIIDYGSGTNQVKIMEGDFLHNLGFKGNGITIAVLDAGFTNAHLINAFNTLWSNNQIVGFKDFVAGDDSVFNESSHGTLVLSTIAANLDGVLVGTAPLANYYLLRTEDGASETLLEEYNWLAGAEFADSVGADIINSSLGYTEFDDASQNHTYSDMDGKTTIITKAANWAAEKGILVVNSAGNSGATPWKFIGAPADAEKIMSVGAIDNDGNYAVFSSQGPTFDGRIKPNVATVGRLAAVINQNNEQVLSNGTSFSSPILAGMMACLWQAFPTKNYQQLKTAVEKSASQFTQPDNFLGYGIPNFRKAFELLSEINDDTKNQIINVFPQPFGNNFNITFYASVNQIIELQLIDNFGKIVLTQQQNVNQHSFETINVNTSSLAAGVYVLRIKSSSKTITKKIIKQFN